MASWHGSIPVLLDANGMVVPLDTKELVYRGETREVYSFLYSVRLKCWFVEFWERVDICVSSCTMPDSWEGLEEDARKNACRYFGHTETCGTCPAMKMPDYDGSNCNISKDMDIIRRAKALAGVTPND